ncbi:hypothetical protein SI65_00212 [Aspergillus cristatus]|uniref:Reverse transcriptase domain-containing protein n=1 Tax=Aspergillus cristatus TaxID=573508 RepID=A0A1E3BNS9_ASPCR|nr:hypothetical protein SI65_00212 [Aspergillus cristatus]
MARPNDTVAPPRANENEMNDNDTDRENRRSSIFIDGGENEERHLVTLDKFLQYAAEKPEWLFGKLQLIHQRFDDCLDEREAQLAEEELHGKAKDGEIALLRCKKEMKGQLQCQTDNNDGDENMDGLRQQVEDVKQQLAEVKAERDAFGSQIARLIMNATNGHQAPPTPANHKSTKIPDPPMLTDGKEPQFEDWLLLMTQKLTANADHFDTPQLRMAYVASRCEGKARRHITPRMRDDTMNLYTDSKDMLDHLKTIYSDPNRVTTAKHQFRQLYMKVNDKFHDFLSEFLYLAAEAGVAKDDWKDELYHKLTTELQKLCISESIKDGTFQEFSSAVSQTASRLEVINHRTQRNRTFTPSNKDTTKGGSSRSGTTIKKEPTPSRSSSPTTPQTGGVGRGRQFEKEERREHYRVPRKEESDRRADMAKMSRALQSRGNSDPSTNQKPQKKTTSQQAVQIDIAAIGAAPFQRHLKKKDTEAFITSLSEIDRIIEERRAEDRQKEDHYEQELIQQLLPKQYQEYADVFSKAASDELPPRRMNDYRIELEEGKTAESAVGYSPLYKQTAEELEAARDYIVDNLNKGFIGPSAAPFASPILMARKPGGGLRFCVDYRKVNAITRKDRYPIPLVDELMERISGAKIFTKLDIRQGFHRIRLDERSEDLTTFWTRYGTYKYHVAPFGLTNGLAAFQRFINDTLMDYLDEFLTAFVDGLLIYSKNTTEHELHVKKVLERLRAAGLQASIKKCEFHVTQTKYLGFILTTDGIEVDPEKTAVICNWAVPTTVRGVQSFLGFCNFYRRFIKNYSRIAKPLNHLTRKNTPFVWADECKEAFEELKKQLTDALILRHYHSDLETKLETDASDGVVAGVLSQKHGDLWHPVAYYSKSMSDAECNDEIHDKEMLAIIRALKEWRAELEGLKLRERFNIYTDHRALEYFMTTKKLNARQARWAEFLSRFYFLIRYRPGCENTLAAALSRPSTEVQKKDDYCWQILLKPESIEQPEGTHQTINTLEPALQVVDQVLSANRNSTTAEEHREKAQAGVDDWTLQDGLLLKGNRLFIPDDDPTVLAAPQRGRK